MKTKTNTETIMQRAWDIIDRHTTGIQAPGDRLIETRTLPRPDVPLVTMTLDELHDLTYHAVTLTLYNVANLPKHRAQDLASMAATTSTRLTDGTDYAHRGPDPRSQT